MEESLVGSKVLSYFAYVTVMCIYIGQPLVVVASRNHTLFNSVTALVINHDTSTDFRRQQLKGTEATNAVQWNFQILNTKTLWSGLCSCISLVHEVKRRYTINQRKIYIMCALVVSYSLH